MVAFAQRIQVLLSGSPEQSWNVSFALQHSPPIVLPSNPVPRWMSQPAVALRKRPSAWSNVSVTWPPARAALEIIGPEKWSGNGCGVSSGWS